MRDGGHGSVGPVAAHDAVEEGRAPSRRKARSATGEPRSAARAAAAAGDELGVVEAVRAGNVEVVVLESIVVVIIFIVLVLVVGLIPDHKNIRTVKIILCERLRDRQSNLSLTISHLECRDVFTQPVPRDRCHRCR